MTELRIAIFTGNYNHIKDGVSLTLNRLVRFLESKGVPVLVIAPTKNNPAIDHEGTMVPVPSIPAPGRPEYRISLTFSEVARQEVDAFRPTLIHVATPDLLGLKALYYAREKGVPLVSSYHTHFASYLQYYNLEILDSLLWKYMFWFYGNCRKVFVPSPSMLKWLNKKGFTDNFTIWARGVNVDLFDPAKRDMKLRKKLGVKDDEKILLFVSRLVWEKDIRTVLDTAKILLKKNPKLKLVIAGDGPIKEEMEREIPEAIFTGFVFGEELAKVYASSDVYLFPSDTESFGNVTLEAMASGLPAVVANAVGSSSLVENKVNGYLTRPKDVEAFAENVQKILDDDELRKTMSENSRAKALNYKWDDIMTGLLNDYREVVESYYGRSPVAKR